MAGGLGGTPHASPCSTMWNLASGHQCKASVTLLLTVLLLIVLPQEEARNSVLIYILREKSFHVTCALGSFYLTQLNSLFSIP